MSIRNFYEHHLLPHAIDCVCGLSTFEQGRKALIAQASGRVLEIGMGTGRNLPYYRPEQLACLCGIDPGLHAKAERRANAAGIHVQLMPLSAERIPVDDGSFDCVVSTFTLCTIPDVGAALGEVRRVLKPGGRLLFLEHGLAPDAGVARWQHLITPGWKLCAGGCHLDRQIPVLIENAGFTMDHLDQGYRAGPKLMTYLYSGSAVSI